MGATLFAVKTTYDPTYYAFSPGVVLFYKIMERIFEDETIASFDFGRGERQYKNEWKVTFDEQVRLSYGHRDGVYGFVRFKVLPTVKRSRRANALLQRMKKARSTTRSIRGKLWTAPWKIELSSRLSRARRLPKTAVMVRTNTVPEEVPEKDRIGSLAFRFATPDDVEALAVAMAARNFKNVIERFENGDRCFMSMDKKRISCYLWLRSRNHREKEGQSIGEEEGGDLVLCDFGPDSCESPDRGRKEFGMLLSMLCTYAEYSRLIAGVDPQDGKKIELLESFGFESDDSRLVDV
jgi:hypothetical protein